MLSAGLAALSMPAVQRIARARELLPPEGRKVFTNYLDGDDVKNDGSEESPWQSIDGALFNILTRFDFGAIIPDPAIEICAAKNSHDYRNIHFAPHGMVGAQGSNAIRINGNGATLHGCAQFIFHAIVRLKNLKFVSTIDALQSLDGAHVYLEDGIEWLGTGGADIFADHGHVKAFSRYKIAGSRRYHTSNKGGHIDVAGLAHEITESQAVESWVAGTLGGSTEMVNCAWQPKAGATLKSATAFNISANHVLTGAATLPFSEPGSKTTGAQAL